MVPRTNLNDKLLINWLNLISHTFYSQKFAHTLFSEYSVEKEFFFKSLTKIHLADKKVKGLAFTTSYKSEFLMLAEKVAIFSKINKFRDDIACNKKHFLFAFLHGGWKLKKEKNGSRKLAQK